MMEISTKAVKLSLSSPFETKKSPADARLTKNQKEKSENRIFSLEKAGKDSADSHG
jgi:hypothetical protein